MIFKIIFCGLVLFSCGKDEVKIIPKKEKEWKPVKHHFDTVEKYIILGDMNVSRIYRSKVKEVWIYSKTGSSILKYIDTNNIDFPENIMPLPDAIWDGKKK